MLNHTVSEQLELNYLRVFDSLLAGSLMTLLCDSVAKKKTNKKNRIRKIKIESKKAQLQIHNIIPAELSGSNTAVVLTIETPDAAFCTDPLTNCHWEESDGLLSQRGKDRVNIEKQQAHINTMKTNKAVTEQLLLFSPVPSTSILSKVISMTGTNVFIGLQTTIWSLVPERNVL